MLFLCQYIMGLLPNTLSTAISGFWLRLYENFLKYTLLFLQNFRFVSLKILKLRYEKHLATDPWTLQFLKGGIRYASKTGKALYVCIQRRQTSSGRAEILSHRNDKRMYRLRQKGKYPIGRHIGEKAEKNFFKATMRRLSSGSDFRFRQFFFCHIT